MSRKNREESFWTGYSDLMTNLFFVMLMLFVLAIALLHKQVVIAEEARIASEKQIKKIEELNRSIEKIDQRYFEYDSLFKRHTLKEIQVSFKTNSSDINDIDQSQLEKLIGACKAIVTFMLNAKTSIPDAQYLLIIEGQSSKDGYVRNYELSYERALALIKYWAQNGIEFDSLGNCEVLIAGSGQASRFRLKPDNAGNKNNQRFVIHIIPKPGTFEK